MKGFFSRVTFFLLIIGLFAGLVVLSSVDFAEVDPATDKAVQLESDYVRSQAEFKDVISQRVVGSLEAPIGLTVYTDFACDGCAEFYEQVLPWLKFAKVGEDEVRLATKFYPLLNKNPESLLVAQSSLCAAEQGDFYSFHDLLFETQDEWKGNVILQDYLIQLAKRARYRESQFRKCLLSGRYEDFVKLELSDAVDKGIKGAPSLVLRKGEDTRLLEGKITVQLLEATIEEFDKETTEPEPSEDEDAETVDDEESTDDSETDTAEDEETTTDTEV